MLEDGGPDVSVMLERDLLLLSMSRLAHLRSNICHLGFLNWPVSRHVRNCISILFLRTLTFTDTIVLYFCKCMITLYTPSIYVEASKLQLDTSSCGVNLNKPHTTKFLCIRTVAINRSSCSCLCCLWERNFRPHEQLPLLIYPCWNPTWCKEGYKP